MFRKILLASFIILALFLGTVGTLMFRGYEPAGPAYKSTAAPISGMRLRSSEEHDEVIRRFGKPYVLELSRNSGALLFYGSRHTSDPNDPQMRDIRKRWKAFRPTVALYEGRQRNFFHVPLLEPLKGKTEAEQLHELATRDRVRVYTLEPEYQDEVRALLTRWPAEKVALYFTMRVYWAEAGGKADDSLALDLLRKRSDVDGLRGSLRELADLDRLWKRDFPSHGDWRTRKDDRGLTYLQEIGNDSRRVRGEHMARALVELVKKGERVFAVAGSGNVIRTEWILRSELGGAPAFDQPSTEKISAADVVPKMGLMDNRAR